MFSNWQTREREREHTQNKDGKIASQHIVHNVATNSIGNEK